jgi:formyl-CoA transferase
LGALIAVMDFQAARWTVDQEVAPQAGNDHPTGVPTGMFKTSDGFMNIAASGDHMFVRLCKALGADEMLDDPRFTDMRKRREHRAEVNAGLEVYTQTRTTDQWVEDLNQAGVPSGPVYTLDQTFADPQVKHLGMAAGVEHPTRGRIDLVGQPVNFHRTPWQLRTATPEMGEHTESILAELGYSESDIAALRDQKAV